jgi:glycolate oxidase FAD binding subunit
MTVVEQDRTETLTDQVRAACARRESLRIVGGDTKRFYGRQVAGTPLDVAGHAGILTYDPSELVLTARAGTRLADVEATLHGRGQHLPFEPPEFGSAATLGGTIATGLAGPARVARGPVRDHVLGATLLSGDGRVLKFGGEVMKNVAGYDVSRLLAGSLGVLGVLLDVSLKVLPLPPATQTLRVACDADRALAWLHDATRRGHTVSASFWHADELHARLEGATTSLDALSVTSGGEVLPVEEATAFWRDVREHRLAFFAGTAAPLWRLHVPANSDPAPCDRVGRWAFEWHGAQRWLIGVDAGTAHALAHRVGGHATLFRGAGPDDEVFAPLAAPLLALHDSVKRVFDPQGILNRGRMYAAL